MADVFRVEFAAFNFGRIIPEGSRLRFHQFAYNHPFQFGHRITLKRPFGAPTAGFCPMTNRPSILPSTMSSQ